MVNNYLKTDRNTGSQIFTFNDSLEESREAAYRKAITVQPDPERLSIWKGEGRDHPYVSVAFKPISQKVPVVGQPSKRFFEQQLS